MKKLLMLFACLALFSCSHSPAYASYSTDIGPECATNPCVLDGPGGYLLLWDALYSANRDKGYKFKTITDGWCASACSIIAGYAVKETGMKPNAWTRFCYCHPSSHLSDEIWKEIKARVTPEWYRALRSGQLFRVINGVIRY